MGVMGVEKQRI